MELVFATNNKHKVREVQLLISSGLRLLTLADINHLKDLDETGNTLEENAIQKASFIFDTYKVNTFADDTGLEIEALNGAPGVYSARYAGEERSSEKNIHKVLKNLHNIKNRNARFKTVIYLIFNNKKHSFEGIVNGIISIEPKGKDGFGYDSIFIPEGHEKTFAEMDISEKNKFSHRGRAINKLAAFLNTIR